MDSVRCAGNCDIAHTHAKVIRNDKNINSKKRTNDATTRYGIVVRSIHLAVSVAAGIDAVTLFCHTSVPEFIASAEGRGQYILIIHGKSAITWNSGSCAPARHIHRFRKSYRHTISTVSGTRKSIVRCGMQNSRWGTQKWRLSSAAYDAMARYSGRLTRS